MYYLKPCCTKMYIKMKEEYPSLNKLLNMSSLSISFLNKLHSLKCILITADKYLNEHNH